MEKMKVAVIGCGTIADSRLGRDIEGVACGQVRL